MLELACTVVCGKANCSIFRNFASQLKAQLKLHWSVALIKLHWSVVPWLETHQKQWTQHSWFLNIYPYIARWIGWRIGGEQQSCSWLELMKNSQRDEKFKDCKRQCRKYRNGGSKEICRVNFFFKKRQKDVYSPVCEAAVNLVNARWHHEKFIRSIHISLE